MKIGSTIASEFDAFSANYTEDMENCVPHYKKLLLAFTKDLPKAFKPEKILDLGCGNGNVTAQLVKVFPNAQFHLLDASNEMLSLCKYRFQETHVNYISSYFNEYLFPENNFHLITAGFSVHHCETAEKKALFKHIYTSLKPKGMFAFTDLMIHKNSMEHPSFLKEWEAFVRKNYPTADKWEWLMEHYDAFDKPDELPSQLLWLQEAGFTSIEPTVYDRYWGYIKAIKP